MRSLWFESNLRNSIRKWTGSIVPRCLSVGRIFCAGLMPCRKKLTISITSIKWFVVSGTDVETASTSVSFAVNPSVMMVDEPKSAPGGRDAWRAYEWLVTGKRSASEKSAIRNQAC